MPKTSKARCTICLGKIKDKVKLPCKHKFCYACITENQKYSNRCPNCRAAYKKYRHKKKTKRVLLNDDLIFAASQTSRYISDIHYRFRVDMRYLRNISSIFLLIKATVEILATSNEDSDVDVFHEIQNHMTHIQTIYTLLYVLNVNAD